MPGLVPGIHALIALEQEKTWMPGTSPAMTGQHHSGLYVPSTIIITLPAQAVP